MKKPAKVLILSSIAVLISALVVFSAVKAGSLTPPSLGTTMYTLEDIYQRLITGAAAGSHSLTPSGAPAGTMHNLSEIYGAIPTINAGEVCSGATYLGTSGTAVCGGTPALVWGADDGNQYTWAEANSYCAGLTDGGYTWRLPTEGELIGAIFESYETGGSGLPGGFQVATSYWSSDSYDSNNAWFSSYENPGEYYSYQPKTIRLSVRCVH